MLNRSGTINTFHNKLFDHKSESRATIATSLLLALAAHGLLIFALSFSLEDPATPSKTMEITLASFPSEKEPEKADYLAQANQQGSGTLDEKARPSSDLPAPIQDTIPKPVQLQEQAAQLPKSTPKKAKQVTTVAKSETIAPATSRVSKLSPSPEDMPPKPRIDLSAEIASLEAEFFQKRQAYAKRPVVHRINAASTRKADVYYQEAWRRKVMRIGTINYPAQARQQKIYGELRVAVQIRRDGSLKSIEIVDSSGSNVLDNAARNIVRMSAPFSPFPPELQEYDVIEIIRTWRFEPGDMFRG
ncbi:energy transducer TonB [Sansalvadorimonas sp. 2012CJ34-2]|uniref:Energy transducer TonB n=1 Tax=Parendozoicomonas callyspongiae TaxID=2942213 RepID=A0ABT0PAN6_9GAMM|nr:energy transducer TonB [Sansalvadorimonas sp. 2012CJ34-2]MCL6268452.1 energy transducer TonB [Sansalvadorimonas sp. 2012CJ34-2]